MDMLRIMAALGIAATHLAERAAHSRPLATLRSLNARTTSARENERGQGLAEYALILGLIAIVAITSLIFLGSTISDLFWAPISEDFGNILSSILG